MTNRKKLVELMQQAASSGSGAPDADWVVRFMNLLHEEDPSSAQALKDAAVQRLKAREQ